VGVLVSRGKGSGMAAIRPFQPAGSHVVGLAALVSDE
jgi:hypothetical protein